MQRASLLQRVVTSPATRAERNGCLTKDDLFETIARALDLPAIRLIETGGDVLEAQREQWDDGNNVLAVSPGVVVAYDRNVATNTRLRHEGIEVITIAGSELSRGRGVLAVCPARSSAIRSKDD